MKNFVLTRKHKEALALHYSKGGSVNNVPPLLTAVPMEKRQSVYYWWQQRRRGDK